MQRELAIRPPVAAVDHAAAIGTSAAATLSDTCEGGDYFYVANVGSYVLFGASPTADETSQYVPADSIVPIGPVAAGHRCSVLGLDTGFAQLTRVE